MSAPLKNQLSPAAQQAVQSASPFAIEKGLQRAYPRLSNGNWLDSTSPFMRGGADGVASVRLANSRSVTRLADYTAAGAILHYKDAWSYLARSLSAASAGQLDAAVHLAYYSELRSAISLLGSNGILISNGHNYTFDRTGAPKLFNNDRTHTAVWKVLLAWATTTTAASTIGNLIEFRGLTLTSWLNAKPSANSLTGSLRDLLGKWGLDLDVYRQDHFGRNFASYEPSDLRMPNFSGYAEWFVVALEDIWTLIEPGGSRRSLPNLDALLLTQTVDALHDAVYGSRNGYPARSAAYETELMTMIRNSVAAPTDELAADLFLPSRRSKTPALMVEAFQPARTVGPPDRNSVLGMIGRSIVLLRLAGGAVNSLCMAAGLASNALDEAGVTGVGYGYWASMDRPDSLRDSWVDGNDAASELINYASSASQFELSSLTYRGSELVAALGVGRAALWLLGA